MKYYIYKNQYDFCFMPKSFSEEEIVYVDGKINTLIEYLKWIRDNSKENYIGFSLDGMSFIEKPAKNIDFNEFEKQNIDLILTTGKSDYYPIHEYYRKLHYDFDIRVALHALKEKCPEYYQDYVSTSLYNFIYYPPSAFISKKFFDEFYEWLYKIKKACNSNLKNKYSIFQQDSFGNLIGILFSVFVMYQKKIRKLLSTDAKTIFTYDDLLEDKLINDELIRKMILRKKPELAKAYIDKDSSNVSDSYSKLLYDYQIEMRYKSQTILDKPFNLDSLLNTYSSSSTVKSNKILIISWKSINFQSLCEGFQKLNLDFEIFEVNQLESNNSITFFEDDNLVKKLRAAISKETYRFVFSQNYFNAIAEACYLSGVQYLAWVYDCPSTVPLLGLANNDFVHIFHFDSSYTNSMLELGYKNIHFLHLAVNTDLYDKIKITPSIMQEYKCDISFVGRLYDFNFTQIIQCLDDYSKAYLKAIIDVQQYKQCHNYASQCQLTNLKASDNQTDFYELVRKSSPNTSGVPRKELMKACVLNYLTYRDRSALPLLLSQNHSFKLYSNEELKNCGHVKQCGTVSYYEEMPLVFKCSKINLNSTMRTIESGIPQRCLDILGAHSVLMSNYQKDFDERFSDGKNVILYETYAEAKEKADFYLAHVDLLDKIKDNGYETVKKYFSYPAAIQEMIDIAGV